MPAAQSAFADYVPGWGKLPINYWSTDMSEVTVDLVHWKLSDRGAKWTGGRVLADGTFEAGKPYQTIRLPRAYIDFANPYSQRTKQNEFRFDVLPDHVVTDHLVILTAAPDEAPYSVVWSNWDKQRPEMTSPIAGELASPDGKNDGQYRRYERKQLEMRALINVVDIWTTSRRAPAHDVLRVFAKRMRWSTPPQRYLGYDSYGDEPHSGYLYINEEATDGVIIVNCRNSLESALKNVLCTYYFAANDDLYVTMRFIDFRVNGGLEFMRARVRSFKKRFCLVLKCDRRALQAANLTEAELDQ